MDMIIKYIYNIIYEFKINITIINCIIIYLTQ